MWVNGGSVFFQLRREQADKLCREEVERLGKEIEGHRTSMKRDAARLFKLAPDQTIDDPSLKLLLATDKPVGDKPS